MVDVGSYYRLEQDATFGARDNFLKLRAATYAQPMDFPTG